MILKFLEIQGFKSFPDKIRIDFDKGLTVVVGPNGSGKSNISDAIRWVMGEQSTKSLRGAKMEDVIFTGTQTRKSVGFAEVSLVIDKSDESEEIDNANSVDNVDSVDNTERKDNTDNTEIVIKRRYYRSGESDYSINGKSVRLKDVNEFFMDTGLGKDGYAIVGQGKIVEVIQAKSTERREIFEEAAGISKYRYRKLEAEKKLTNAQENLVRLKDILTGLKDRIEPLHIQSEKARQFIAYADEKKQLEISVWVDFLHKQDRLIQNQDDKIMAISSDYEQVIKKIKRIEDEIENIYNDTIKCRVYIDELRSEKDYLSNQMTSKTSNIAVLKNDLIHNDEARDRFESELELVKNSDKETQNKLFENQSKLEKLQNHVSEIEKSIIEKTKKLEKITQKSEETINQVNDFNITLNELILKQSQNTVLISQIENTIVQDDSIFNRNKNVFETKKSHLKIYEKELEQSITLMSTVDEKVVSANNEIAGYKLKIKSKQDKKDEINELLSSTTAQAREKEQKAKLLQELEKNLEGFAYSVKAVLKQSEKGFLRGIKGSIAQIIDVDDRFAVAIETALARAVQNIVVNNETDAKKAIEFLTSSKSGRATFLPLTSVKGDKLNADKFKNEYGFVGIASDLVEHDKAYDGVINSLLGRTLIVEDLDCAVDIAKKNNYRTKIVTLDGQVVNSGGSLTGGSRNKTESILSRATEIKKLQKQSDELNAQVNILSEQAKGLQCEIDNYNVVIQEINGDIINMKEDYIRGESEKKRLDIQIENEVKTLKLMQEQLDGYFENTKLKKEQIKMLKAENDDISNKIDIMKKQIQSVQDENIDNISDKEKLVLVINNLNYERLDKNKDIESCQISVSEIKLKLKNQDEYIGKIRQNLVDTELKNQEIEKQLTNSLDELSSNKTRISDIDVEVSIQTEKRNLLEQKSSEIKQLEKQENSKKENLSRENARIQERRTFLQKEYDDITDKLWNEYELAKNEAIQIAKPIANIDEANDRLYIIRSNIKDLGNVNLSAIEEYAEVSSRYKELDLQIADVEKSKEELTKMIYELTSNMRAIFADSFEKINENFKKIFVSLFGGGRAYLSLSTPNDVLNSGIDIFVEPPGKVIKNLSLLSGGEQSFVAIAIYFAILKVRPAPFCVLDEIEAALDDVNVSKYASYLKTISSKTQFIAITHRRGTMEEADELYGVTMQDEGISKLLKLTTKANANAKNSKNKNI